MASWTHDLPAAPQLGDDLPKPQMRPDTLSYLAQRRSLTVAQMDGPGPDSAELSALLTMAARVPDHRRVHPFRFVVIEGLHRKAFGEILEEAFKAREPNAAPEQVALERGRFERAPVVVAVVSKVDPKHKTPEWEQVLTAGAVCQNLIIAAGAAGFAAQWLTEWYAYDDTVTGALGMADHERVAGFVYLGTASDTPKERARMDAKDLTSSWTSRPYRG